MEFKLRLSLFLGLIAVPAGILTFLSLRAVLDEQHGRSGRTAHARTRTTERASGALAVDPGTGTATFH